jgi:hypothetical protein
MYLLCNPGFKSSMHSGCMSMKVLVSMYGKLYYLYKVLNRIAVLKICIFSVPCNIHIVLQNVLVYISKSYMRYEYIFSHNYLY